MSEPRPPRFAVADSEGRLRILAVTGPGAVADVAPALHPGAVEDGALPRLSWPTWLPDGRVLVAATTVTGRPGLHLVEPGTNGSTLVFRPRPGMPRQIAPGVPFFANPAPDGLSVLLATPGERAILLMLLDLDAGGDGEEITRGAPVFTAWAPGSDVALIHTGPTIQRLDRAPRPLLTTVALNAVDLRVPAWSPDGSLFATVRHGETRNALVLLDRAGHHAARVAAVEGPAAIGWSPDGGCIAVAPMSGGGIYSGIDIVDVRAGETRPLVRDRMTMWLWAPDSRRIAYLRPAGPGGQMAWRVVALTGGRALTSAPFFPSTLFSVMVAFFDQYALAHRLWSPDGRYLLASGRLAVDGPPSDAWGGSVLLWEARGGHPIQSVAHGEFASWQPAGSGG